MSQTAYTFQAAEAFAGLLGDTNLLDTVSRANEEVVDMEFGIGVTAGTLFSQMLLPITTVPLLGVTAHRHHEDRSLAGDDGIAASGGNAEVVTKGSVWVHIDQDVTLASGVFVRVAGGNQGWFRADVDVANAEAVPGARWERPGTAAVGFALLDINLPA